MSTEAVVEPCVATVSIRRHVQEDPAWVRWSLTGFAVIVVGPLVVVPVVNVFAEALG